MGAYSFRVYSVPSTNRETPQAQVRHIAPIVVLPACTTQVSAHNVFLIALLCLRLSVSTSTQGLHPLTRIAFKGTDRTQGPGFVRRRASCGMACKRRHNFALGFA